MAEIH